MASDVPSDVHFDFESEIPKSSGIHFLSGGVGDLRAANVPNLDACMANAKGNDGPLENHGLVDMQVWEGHSKGRCIKGHLAHREHQSHQFEHVV